MGSPYLNSGESITMTTHRVGVDSIPYDVMLTTHRLTLIDSRYARFEPLMIAFEDILTVKSGAVSTGEPVILLTYNGADDEVREMNLIFSQQPGEHRKHERDLWVKKLMESIIAEREKTTLPDESAVTEQDGMQPAIRRWVAPEGIAPHTPFAAKDAAQPAITIIPDDEGYLFERAALPEEPEEPEETSEDLYTDLTGNAGAGETGSFPAPEPAEPVAEAAGYGYGDVGEDGEDEFIPAPPANPDLLHKFHTIVIPFVPADKPAGAVPSPGDERPQELQKVPAETILAAAESLIPKEPVAEVQEAAPAAEEPAGPEAGVEPVEDSSPATVAPTDEHLPGSGLPAPEAGSTITEPVVEMKHDKNPVPEQSPVKSPAMQEMPGEAEPPKRHPDELQEAPQSFSPAKRGDAPTRGSPDPSGRDPAAGPKGAREPPVPVTGEPRGLLPIMLVIVALLALAGIIVIVFTSTPMNSVVSPGPTTVPTISPLPATTQAVISIPAEGAGFRVIYPGDFVGEVGNPGQMKMVSGNGDIFFPVQKNDDLVQASIHKQDNSGNTLTVEVYNNGRMISARSIRTPRGYLDILLDVRTGMSPGMTPASAVSNLATQGKPVSS